MRSVGGEVTVRAQGRLDQFRGCTLPMHRVPQAEDPDTPKHVLDVQVSALDVGCHVTGRRVTTVNMDQLVVATRSERERGRLRWRMGSVCVLGVGGEGEWVVGRERRVRGREWMMGELS